MLQLLGDELWLKGQLFLVLDVLHDLKLLHFLLHHLLLFQAFVVEPHADVVARVDLRVGSVLIKFLLVDVGVKLLENPRLCVLVRVVVEVLL